MLMFRFWGSDSRGGEQTVKLDRPMLHDFQKPLHPISQTIAPSGTGAYAASRTWKRERDEEPCQNAPAAKRPRQAHVDEPVVSAPPPAPVSGGPKPSHLPDDRLDNARDAIQFHFGLEILHKHDELRLIDQELAKCQVALEQLRRCHLIPYPINSPTPDQMIDICNGKGPALRKPGKEVPRWAPPFGVIDGPYARHYAKWLIPDPMFDGMLPEWKSPYDSRAARSSTEGRTTRNSVGDGPLVGKQRPVRGNAGQKLQTLMNGYPPAKEKNGPCVLKRQSDGQTVKLVCLDCNRENFLSIQGFINHCRIAHRRDFKSHEEAAIQSGQPYDASEAKPPATPKPASEEPKPQPVAAPSAPPPQSGLVHPYAQPEIERQQAFAMLQSRIQDSIRLYKQGKMPGVTRIPGAQGTEVKPSSPSLVPSSETPYLSQLMKAKNIDGDLQQLVGDAKTKVDFDEVLSPSEELEEPVSAVSTGPAPPATRMPARTVAPSAQHTASTHPANIKGTSPTMSYAEPLGRKHKEPQNSMVREEDEVMDADLSPNPTASNNAPSLVSDDGEYDDSDDGSSESDASDNIETGSLSDVADITMEDDGDAARSLRHHGDSGNGTTVRLRKEDKKHMAFVSPVKDPSDHRGTRNI